MPVFSDIDIDRFVRDGFLKLEEAFPRETGDRIRDLLWEQIGLSPDRPVVWAADHTGQGPFGEAIGSPRLAEAFDQLAGAGGWVPRGTVGMAPIRFPSEDDSGDTGWHIDQNDPGPGGAWGVVTAHPRTMLLLLLYSEVGPGDAPTRIRVGSHLDAARVLEPYGEAGVEFFASGPLLDEASAHRPVAYATGLPGDAYLCHPFLIHAAQRHRGSRPRFMSQMPVFLSRPLRPDNPAPLGRALRAAPAG
ncbi:phytanoyl-CoA dioxygenase [Microbispora sp. RL4-1S]|uniref:Phytanoyl-CoA dioxygenase n=1 Tax=Microbispora oryzae TaxID=2806554 RepID=A0A941AM38_9ACTN|nr:phytanoyl-CoA dioxygenase [Microbispora oryzae]MBP2707952.1 phytanoyl-CoA dioxygenase [Microbispora oryzae]